MVVGGQESFVKEKLSRSLERHGIAVHTHLSWTKSRPPATLPKGIDLVYVCTDMVGHKLAEPCVKHARDNGIPFVNGTRKWAESIERLTQAGFPLVDPVGSLPDIIGEVVAARPPGSKPTESDLRGVAIAIMGDVEKAEAYLNPEYDEKTGAVIVSAPPSLKPVSPLITAALPELARTNKESAMSIAPVKSIQAPAYRNSQVISNPKQQEYLKVLVKEPRLMNKEMWSRLSTLPLFAGQQLDPQRCGVAREQLGIKVWFSDSKRIVDIDLEKFMETAETLGIKYVLPEAHYEDLNEDAPGTGTKAPTPVAASASPTLGNANVLELLAALRAAMKAENYTEIHLTESGVSYKKVVVQEGNFAI